MSSEKDRIDVDTLEKGIRIFPPGSYIGGELTALRGKTVESPLMFHLSTKTRQGRSTIVVQCAKFPATLDGTGVLEEAHSFLEKRFRQHIRLKADVGDLEVVDIVQQKRGAKRIDARYGFGGTILAQDGSEVHLKEATSWFPSQNSSEGGAKQSSSEQLATVPSAAQNSPLAAFPVSPPISEPPSSTVKKSSKPSDDAVGVSARLAVTASIAEDRRDGKRLVKRIKIESAFGAEDRGSNSSSKGKQREITEQVPQGFDVERPQDRLRLGREQFQEPSGIPSTSREADPSTTLATSIPVIKVSALVANPSLMVSLTVQQREALRQAAEQKWLARHPSFKPEGHGGIEEPRIRAHVTQKELSSDLQAPPTKVEPGRTEGSNPVHDDHQLEASEPPEAIEEALAEKGGLVVPATAESGEVEYLPLSRLLAKGLKSTPPRNLIAVVQEARGDQIIGSRGDALQRLRLVDPSHSEQGPWLSLFSRSDEPRLPPNLAPGTVVLVRGVKVFWDSKGVTIKCPAHADWTYCVLFAPSGTILKFEKGADRRRPTTPPLTTAEKEKMIKLQQWFVANRSLAGPEDGETTISARGQRVNTDDKTFSIVADREFCDLTVEIISVINTPYPTKREFLVTDYTKNQGFLFDEYRVPGIPEIGYLTILALWDGVALSADRNAINDGDIVRFRNVAIKESSGTRYGVEGNVREHVDASGTSYRRYQVLDSRTDPRAQALVERRESLKTEMLLKHASRELETPKGMTRLNQHLLALLDGESEEFRTRHRQQPISRIRDVSRNPLPDNVFRLTGWATRIQTSQPSGGAIYDQKLQDMVIRRCTICDRHFEDSSCAFCKTSILDNLEYQYLFWVDLQDEKESPSARLSVIVSSRFLSNALPPLPAVTTINKQDDAEITAACRQVEQILQGPVSDGKKQCRLIDLSVARWGIELGSRRVEGLFACGMENLPP